MRMLILVHGDNLERPDLSLQYRLSLEPVQPLGHVELMSHMRLNEWHVSYLVEPKARHGLHLGATPPCCSCACSDTVCGMCRTVWLLGCRQESSQTGALQKSLCWSSGGAPCLWVTAICQLLT